MTEDYTQIPFSVIGSALLTQYASAFLEGSYTYKYNMNSLHSHDFEYTINADLNLHLKGTVNSRPYDDVTHYTSGDEKGDTVEFGGPDFLQIQGNIAGSTYLNNQLIYAQLYFGKFISQFSPFIAHPGTRDDLFASIIYNAVKTSIVYYTPNVPTVVATFRPDYGISLADTAQLGGYIGFNWTQKVIHLEGDSPYYSLAHPDTPLTTTSGSFADPGPGGYISKKTDGSLSYNYDDAYPFYLNAAELKGLSTPYSVSTNDTPSDFLLKKGEYIEFQTDLVGILPGGIPGKSLYEFQWYSTFNGTVGGAAVLNSNQSPDPGSGQGTAEITSEVYPLGNGVVPMIGAGPDQLALQLSENAHQGDAEFLVLVDGRQIGGPQTISALHGSGSSTVLVNGDWGPGDHTFTLDLLNDLYGGTAAADRNLFLDSATYNGTAVSGAQAALYKSGPLTLLFDHTPTTVPISVGAGPDQLVLNLSENAYQGDAQYTVSVDGQPIGGPLVASALHGAGSSAVLVNGDWAPGAHTFTLDFLNDLYGGTTTTDRNLYLDGATYNGATVSGAQAALYRGGPVSLQFDQPGAKAAIDQDGPHHLTFHV